MNSLERHGAARKLLTSPEIGLGVILVLMFAFSATFSRRAPDVVMDPSTGMPLRDADGQRVTVDRNTFLTPSNLQQLTRDASYFAIMAVGATLVLVCGGVDLSIGSIFCLSAMVGATVMSTVTYTGKAPAFPEQEAQWIAEGILPSAGTRIVLGVLAGLATGAVCGMVNGLLITSLKSPPFLITLGTMLIFRSIAFLMTKGSTVGSLPTAFVQDFGQNMLPIGLNVHIPITLFVVAIGWLYLSHSIPGRMTLAIGGNEEAARTAGLPVRRIKVLTYTLAGALGGVAGLLYLAYYGASQSGDGTGYELSVIAATVIGGASLMGGRGTAIGALLGTLFLQLIKNSLFTLQIDQNYEQLVIGIVIVSAAGFDRLRQRLTNA